MIAIVTDSTISIARKDAAALGLYIVSDSYSINGVPFLEGYADENGKFEKWIFADPEKCRTSQPPVTAFSQTFEELTAKGMDVLCLTISSRLSGTFSSACIAAQEMEKGRVAVVDSLSTSGGLWLLAKAARALIDGGASLCEAAQKLQELRDRTGIAFSVDDMAALRRSGRLGFVPQSVSTVLNIRPILLCSKGSIVARSAARGNAERVRRLVGHVPEDAAEIIVHYLGERENAEPLYLALCSRFPGVPVHVSRLGPVLGIHLGAGTIGVSWITK